MKISLRGDFSMTQEGCLHDPGGIDAPVYIRHCQESNSQPVPSQAGADTTIGHSDCSHHVWGCNRMMEHHLWGATQQFVICPGDQPNVGIDEDTVERWNLCIRCYLICIGSQSTHNVALTHLCSDFSKKNGYSMFGIKITAQQLPIRKITWYSKC